MNTMDLQTVTGLLNLDGFEVVEATADAKTTTYRFVVSPTEVLGVCPHCGRPTDDRHACHDRDDVVDLPLGGWKTELAVREFQFHCAPCDKFFTPRQASLAPGAHATERFLERLAELATQAEVSTAARFLGVPEKTAEKWYYDYLERRRREPVKGLLPIESLGIDELSLKKDTANSSAC